MCRFCRSLQICDVEQRSVVIAWRTEPSQQEGMVQSSTPAVDDEGIIPLPWRWMTYSTGHDDPRCGILVGVNFDYIGPHNVASRCKETRWNPRFALHCFIIKASCGLICFKAGEASVNVCRYQSMNKFVLLTQWLHVFLCVYPTYVNVHG